MTRREREERKKGRKKRGCHVLYPIHRGGSGRLGVRRFDCCR